MFFYELFFLSIFAVGSILGYVFYWLTAIVVLVYMKFTEGRTTIVGRESAAGRRRRELQAARAAAEEVVVGEKSDDDGTGQVDELPR